MGEVGAGEEGVAARRDGGFEDGHTVEIAEEVRALDGGCVEALFAKFAEEAAIAVVDGIGDTAEVADKIVGCTSVDMVDGHAGRDLLIAPGYIDSMGSKDVLKMTKGILEVQIVGFAVRVGFSMLYRSRIRQYFSPVGIDAHTNHAALSVVDVERDTGLGAGGDIAHLHVIKEEGRTYQIRPADDFKTALAHNNQGFGCRSNRQR